MKQIKAVIQPDKLSSVREALQKTGCYHGVMISDIMGNGSQKGIIQAWRGEKYQMDLLPKVVIDLIVKDDEVETIKNAILQSARSGEIGDGKIFVSNIEEVVRIRTGEEGENAL